MAAADITFIKDSVREEGFVLTLHADEEATDEIISVKEIHEAILNSVILEDYPEHPRGPCCLLYGQSSGGRNLHLVVTSEKRPVRLITVYEPKPTEWISPVTRE